MKTINLVGCGRVGQTLGRLWQLQNTFVLQDVLTTSLTSARAACDFMGAGRPVAKLQSMRPADLWLIATPDAQLAQTASALAVQVGTMTPGLAFHGSGALSAAQLAPLAALGWQTASAHCILSFASPAVAVTQFSGTPCALEGDVPACAVLTTAFSAIGARCFALASEQKLLYHAAAVFATNFLPVLQSVAEDAWRSTGVPADVIADLRVSLLNKAVANITSLGPAAALTGPAARGDVAAIDRQALAVSAWNPEAGAAYEALSVLALRMAACHVVEPG